MAKKKTTRNQQPPEKSEGTTTPYALRLETELFEKLKQVAGEASISMNQLIQGICDAAMKNCHVGEPKKISGGLIDFDPVPGCIAFGDFENKVAIFDGKRHEVSEFDDQEMLDEADYVGIKGTIWFGLDYSGRGYRKY